MFILSLSFLPPHKVDGEMWCQGCVSSRGCLQVVMQQLSTLAYTHMQSWWTYTPCSACSSSVSWSQRSPCPQCGCRCELKKSHWCHNGDDMASLACEVHLFHLALLLPGALVQFLLQWIADGCTDLMTSWVNTARSPWAILGVVVRAAMIRPSVSTRVSSAQTCYQKTYCLLQREGPCLRTLAV